MIIKEIPVNFSLTFMSGHAALPTMRVFAVTFTFTFQARYPIVTRDQVYP